MSRKYAPRFGSLGYRPRKRAKTETPKIRSWPKVDEVIPLAFWGFKAGMTHLVGVNAKKNTLNINQEIAVPATVLAVPPMKCFGFRVYSKTEKGLKVETEVLASKFDKFLPRKIKSLKKGKEPDFKKIDALVASGVLTHVVLLVHSQPVLTPTGSKTPHICEVDLGGKTVEDKIKYAKGMLGTEIKFEDVFNLNEYVDVKGVTKGKGMQGPVKRFGVSKLSHKAKKIRIVGSIGAWTPSAVLWTVGRPGQMGYHVRTEYNKKILMVGEDGNKVTPKGGFLRYGNVKSPFVILAGSVQGPANRVLGLRKAIRPPKKETVAFSEISMVSTSSQQGV